VNSRHAPSSLTAWLCPHCGADQTAALAAGCASGVKPGDAQGSACGSGCATGGGCALLVCSACGNAFPHPQRSGLTYRLTRWLSRLGQDRVSPGSAPSKEVP